MPPVHRFVAYYRVSTAQQGRSGLGLEAQQVAVRAFLNGGSSNLLSEHTEVESGRMNDRPELLTALAECRRHKAKLVIAKLDRLARNAAFLLTLRDSGVDFVAADNPHADKLMIGVMAVFSEHERDMISQRTKDALKAAKARGVQLGNPRLCDYRAAGSLSNKTAAVAFSRNLKPLVLEIQGQGFKSLRAVAVELNRRAVATARGGVWGPQTVANVLRLSTAQG